MIFLKIFVEASDKYSLTLFSLQLEETSVPYLVSNLKINL